MTKDSRLIIILVFQILVGIGISAYLKNSSIAKSDETSLRTLAAKLESVGVTSEAIKTYEEYLTKSNLENKERSKIAYSLGQLSERSGEFEKAIKWYYQVENLDPNSEYKNDANKSIVAILEKLKKYSAANMVLAEKSSLNPNNKKTGKVVAKISGKELYDYELNEFIDSLPQNPKDDMKNPNKKNQLLQAFVADRIIFDHAINLGFDKDPEIRKKLNQIEKQLIATKVFESEIQTKIKLDDSDVENYYNSNKEKFNNKPFPEVKDEVKQTYMVEKAQKLYQELVQEKIKTAQVELFLENAK